MKNIKKENKTLGFSSQLPKDAFKRESNPIDEVMKKILEKDSKSCKLASARLSQIERSEEIEKKRKENEKKQ